jgi:hypothetical protein
VKMRETGFIEGGDGPVAAKESVPSPNSEGTTPP